MRSLLFMIMAILLLSCVNSKCGEKKANSVKDCKGETPEEGYKYCCYVDAGDDGKACLALTQDDYDNIKDYIKKIEEDNVKVKSLDCKSNYLKFCLISLLVILL